MKMKGTLLLLSLLLFILTCLDDVHAFRRGDTIHMSKRSSHQEVNILLNYILC